LHIIRHVKRGGRGRRVILDSLDLRELRQLVRGRLQRAHALRLPRGEPADVIADVITREGIFQAIFLELSRGRELHQQVSICHVQHVAKLFPRYYYYW
jgi:hypothetical protein